MSHYGNVTQVLSEIALSHVVALRSFGQGYIQNAKRSAFVIFGNCCTTDLMIIQKPEFI